ncbi:MAG: phage/plasmid primase, P4 family [Clostridia bacterium]|nr:phage/plasmid primase, P4 family [Clostridia bacterium]
MFYGATTRNGKSTLLDTMEYLFGDYASHIQPETLAQQKDRNSRSASGDIARLDGVRLLHMSEPPKRMKFDVALLKTLLGRDKITARHLYEREFEFVPVFKLVVNTNYLPVVTDDTLFSSERVKVITFNRHFTPEEQDRELKGRLKSSENISGIFNWLLDGLKVYQQAGKRILAPESVKQATAAYREQSDKIKQFMRDCLIPTQGACVSGKEVYEAFSFWCKDNGYGTENKTNFFDELRSKGILSDSGTVSGRTQRNVVKDYQIDPAATPPTYYST